MAWPFTSLTTFIANNAPTIKAAFLNAIQATIVGLSYRAYDRIKYRCSCINGSSVVFDVIEGFIALDSATSQYVGVDLATAITVSSGFTNTSWNYIYVRVTNGVAAYSVSTTAPEATLRYKSGDETYRYLCACYKTGGSIQFFQAVNGDYLWGCTPGYYTLPGDNTFYTYTPPTGTVSPTAKRVSLYNAVAGTTLYVQFRPTGSTGSVKTLEIVTNIVGIPLTVWLNSSQEADLLCSTSGVGMYVGGFTE